MYSSYPQNNYTYPQNYQQSMQNWQQPQITLQGYPVPDEMTAREAQVNTNGTISIFPDIQNGKIYTKQLDMNTFNPIFKVYKLVEEPQQRGNYVSLEDFQMLQNYVANLEMKINEMQMIVPVKSVDKKGVRANVQSNANDGKQSNSSNDVNATK